MGAIHKSTECAKGKSPPTTYREIKLRTRNIIPRISSLHHHPLPRQHRARESQLIAGAARGSPVRARRHGRETVG